MLLPGVAGLLLRRRRRGCHRLLWHVLSFDLLLTEVVLDTICVSGLTEVCMLGLSIYIYSQPAGRLVFASVVHSVVRVN